MKKTKHEPEVPYKLSFDFHKTISYIQSVPNCNNQGVRSGMILLIYSAIHQQRHSQNRRPPFCQRLERPQRPFQPPAPFSGIVPGKVMEWPGTVRPTALWTVLKAATVASFDWHNSYGMEKSLNLWRGEWSLESIPAGSRQSSNFVNCTVSYEWGTVFLPVADNPAAWWIVLQQ